MNRHIEIGRTRQENLEKAGQMPAIREAIDEHRAHPSTMLQSFYEIISNEIIKQLRDRVLSKRAGQKPKIPFNTPTADKTLEMIAAAADKEQHITLGNQTHLHHNQD